MFFVYMRVQVVRATLVVAQLINASLRQYQFTLQVASLNQELSKLANVLK